MSDNSTPTPMYDFLRPIQEEFNNCMLGPTIGEGKYRVVYEHPTHGDEFVMKIEIDRAAAQFSNHIEWRVWAQLQNSEAGKWLAPCHLISSNGNILVQKRVQPIAPELIPEIIPDFLKDVHDKNWGLYEGRPVMHDYGFIAGFTNPVVRSKLKMVKRAKVLLSRTT